MNSSTTAAPHRDGRGGIRTELVVGSPGCCPVADASASTGRPACQVSRSPRDEDGCVAGEFELKHDGDESRSDDPDLDGAAYERVFCTSTGDVYRFDDGRCDPCPCETIETLGIPLSAVSARRGQLHLTFHARDPETVRDVVEALRARYGEVSVRQMRHAGDDHTERPVLVDRNRLTDRQLEVVETAWRLGYFEDPRGASATDVAEALDIARSTFSEHLAAAQRKVLGDLLER